MATHAIEPAGERSVGVTGEANQDGGVDAFGEEPQGHFNPLGVSLEVI